MDARLPGRLVRVGRGTAASLDRVLRTFQEQFLQVDLAIDLPLFGSTVAQGSVLTDCW